MANAPTDFNPLFQDSLEFVKNIVVDIERKAGARLEPEDLAELFMDTIRNMDDTTIKRKWMRVNRQVKKQLALKFGEEANAMRQNTGWKW